MYRGIEDVGATNTDAENPAEQMRLRDVFKARLSELTRQCCLGKLYVREWRVLVACLAQYPALREVDTALFGVARTALPGQAVMVLARLVDKHPNAAGVHWLLNSAEQNIAIFPYRREMVRQAVVEDRCKLDELAVSVQNLRCLRDKYYAHFDKASLTSLGKLHDDYPFGPDDADDLYETIGNILNRYSGHLLNWATCMETPFGKRTGWLLGFLSKSLEAANMPGHQQNELVWLLDELYHISEKELEIRPRDHGVVPV